MAGFEAKVVVLVRPLSGILQFDVTLPGSEARVGNSLISTGLGTLGGSMMALEPCDAGSGRHVQRKGRALGVLMDLWVAAFCSCFKLRGPGGKSEGCLPDQPDRVELRGCRATQALGRRAWCSGSSRGSLYHTAPAPSARHSW
jgi:hypothetical protein